MEITLGNWIYNAGIVGFLRILQEDGIKIETLIQEKSFKILPEYLDGFEEAYFKYVWKNAAERFLTSKNPFQKVVEETDYKDIRLKFLEQIRGSSKEISWDSFRENIKNSLSESFNTIEEIIKANQKSKDKEKAYKVLEKLKKEAEDALESNKYAISRLRRFYFNKAVVGQFSDGRNAIAKFKERYVFPAQRIVKNGFQSTNSVLCRFCNKNPVTFAGEKVDFVFNQGFFSPASVSLNDFKNFFYKGEADLFLCPLCALILLCSFAGVNTKPYKLHDIDETDFIFVNIPDLHLLFEENEKISTLYWRIQNDDLKDSIYESIIEDLLLKNIRGKSAWVLQNIFFVELKTSANPSAAKPLIRYFPIGKDSAKLFTEPTVQNALKKIQGGLEIQKGVWIQDIRYRVIKQILANESLYPLAYSELKKSIETNWSSQNPYEMVFIESFKRNIQKKLKNKGGHMEGKNIHGILYGFSQSGREFSDKIQKEKRERLSYRLLSFIHTGKYTEFYEGLMKLYISYGLLIPDKILTLLNKEDTIDFEAKAYAFMTGFLQGKWKDSETIEENLKMEVSNA